MTSLTAACGQYHALGYDATLLIPWGGDAVFDWVVPEVSASVLAATQVSAIVAAPESKFQWE